jgi:hypothetical protein
MIWLKMGEEEEESAGAPPPRGPRTPPPGPEESEKSREKMSGDDSETSGEKREKDMIEEVEDKKSRKMRDTSEGGRRFTSRDPQFIRRSTGSTNFVDLFSRISNIIIDLIITANITAASILIIRVIT